MYLFLGRDTVVDSRTVMGIFDFDSTSVSRITREFLSGAGQKHRVVNVSYELPKSFVLCCQNQEFQLYISPVSAQTLKSGRCGRQASMVMEEQYERRKKSGVR